MKYSYVIPKSILSAVEVQAGIQKNSTIILKSETIIP